MSAEVFAALLSKSSVDVGAMKAFMVGKGFDLGAMNACEVGKGIMAGVDTVEGYNLFKVMAEGVDGFAHTLKNGGSNSLSNAALTTGEITPGHSMLGIASARSSGFGYAHAA